MNSRLVEMSLWNVLRQTFLFYVREFQKQKARKILLSIGRKFPRAYWDWEYKKSKFSK